MEVKRYVMTTYHENGGIAAEMVEPHTLEGEGHRVGSRVYVLASDYEKLEADASSNLFALEHLDSLRKRLYESPEVPAWVLEHVEQCLEPHDTALVTGE
ncbi:MULTISPECIES: hypothetical protein [Pseudomonas]|uniref:Uncharacterized protein n=1 Tax=Pseudomonas lutea TaxID=243924 RepID=A0A9X8MH70_9PSED|nr:MULTISPECIES: hypothetical protein [Pseudomonas]SER37816.1 hypothetical protein SAMN05216409_118112 [Pseudomonas lutea]